MGFALETSRARGIRPRKSGPAAFDRHFQTRPESSLARYTVSVFLLSLAREPGLRDWSFPQLKLYMDDYIDRDPPISAGFVLERW